MAAVANYLDQISSHQCITWSNDHRIGICADKYMRCLTMNCDSTSTENKVGFVQSSTHGDSKILDIPQFSQSYHTLLINNLPREEFKILATDRVLNPMKYSYDSVPHTGIARVEWSPSTSDGLCERSILASLSFDHRLCLLWQKDSQYYWYKICDLTELRICKTRKDVNTFEDYYPYKKWCFSQAVTTMKWYPEVITDGEKGNKFMVLAAGMKSGHVVLWNIGMPCGNESDCSIVCTIQPREIQICSLEWCAKLGMLVIGYEDGQIHGLHINLKDLNKTPDCTCLYGESSLLKPASMCFLYNVQEDAYILVVSAEHCVLAMHLSSDGRTVISQTHLFVENEFPSVGMYPLTSDSVLMTSHEAILQKIVTTIGKEGIQLRSEKIPLELPAETPYVCHGFCLSPNKIFAAFVIRPWPSFDHLDPKFKNVTSMVYVRCMDDLVKGSNCRDSCTECLMNTSEHLGSMTDTLELFRLMTISEKNGEKDVEEVDAQVSKLRYNQLQRLKKSVQSERLKNKVKWEEFKDSIERLEKDVYQLSCIITAYWINEAWKNIKTSNISYSDMSETDKSVLHAMLMFLDKNAEVMVKSEDVAKTREAMKQYLSTDSCVDRLKCCVCKENLQLLQSCWKCNNGHSFSICNLTCLPVDGVEYSTCQVCHTVTKHLKECTWLAVDRTRCLFCQSMMFA